jgi:ribosomal protein S27AE
MNNWGDRHFVACSKCGSIYIGTPTRTGSVQVQTARCRRCGNTTFDQLRD